MHIIHCIGCNAYNTLHRMQCMKYIAQKTMQCKVCIEYNRNQGMLRIQCNAKYAQNSIYTIQCIEQKYITQNGSSLYDKRGEVFSGHCVLPAMPQEQHTSYGPKSLIIHASHTRRLQSFSFKQRCDNITVQEQSVHALPLERTQWPLNCQALSQNQTILGLLRWKTSFFQKWKTASIFSKMENLNFFKIGKQVEDDL